MRLWSGAIRLVPLRRGVQPPRPLLSDLWRGVELRSPPLMAHHAETEEATDGYSRGRARCREAARGHPQEGAEHPAIAQEQQYF